MRTEILHLTDKNINQVFFGAYNNGGSTNNESRARMKKIMFDALNNELTDRQRMCLVEHYLNGRKEKEIALELGLSPSTVSRHIRFGKQKLQRIAQYYM